MNLGKTTPVVLEGCLWESAPGFFTRGCFFFFFFFFLCVWGDCFWFGFLLSLSPVCAGCYPFDRQCIGVQPVCASQEMVAMCRDHSQCLVAGPLTMASTLGLVAQAMPDCRALGSDSDPQAGVKCAQSLRQWQHQGMCVTWGVRAMCALHCDNAVPSSVIMTEVTRAAGGACS